MSDHYIICVSHQIDMKSAAVKIHKIVLPFFQNIISHLGVTMILIICFHRPVK